MPEDLGVRLTDRAAGFKGCLLFPPPHPRAGLHSCSLPRLGFGRDFTFLGRFAGASSHIHPRGKAQISVSIVPLSLSLCSYFAHEWGKDGCSLLANVIDGQGKQDLACFCYTGLFNPETVGDVFKRERRETLPVQLGGGMGRVLSFLLAPSKEQSREPWGPGLCG